MRVVSAAEGGPAPYYRVSQLTYDSVEDLQAGIASEDGRSAAGGGQDLPQPPGRRAIPQDCVSILGRHLMQRRSSGTWRSRAMMSSALASSTAIATRPRPLSTLSRLSARTSAAVTSPAGHPLANRSNLRPMNPASPRLARRSSKPACARPPAAGSREPGRPAPGRGSRRGCASRSPSAFGVIPTRRRGLCQPRSSLADGPA